MTTLPLSPKQQTPGAPGFYPQVYIIRGMAQSVSLPNPYMKREVRSVEENCDTNGVRARALPTNWNRIKPSH